MTLRQVVPILLSRVPNALVPLEILHHKLACFLGTKDSSEANCSPTQGSSFNKLLLYLQHILIFSKFGFIDQSRKRNISVGGTDANASRPTVLVAQLQLEIN